MKRAPHAPAHFAFLALLALPALLAAAACAPEKSEESKGPSAKAAAKGASPATPTPLAVGAADVPPPAQAADALAMRKAIAEFTLTEKTLDAIVKIERELGDFWADPTQARSIRSERSLPKILAAIDAAPRLKATIEKNGLTPREYILGSFSCIAAMLWEHAKAQDPKALAAQVPPVSEATLVVVKKRMDDVVKLFSPPPQKKSKVEQAHED